MKIRLLFCLLLCYALSQAQAPDKKTISVVNPSKVALAPLLYLASDELKGRGYDRPEINVAAQYIADQFKSFGIKTIIGADRYFQPFTLKVLTPGTAGQVTIGGTAFKPGDNVVQYIAADVNVSAPLLYAGHPTADELEKLDVKGKIVMLDMGKGDQQSLMSDFMGIPAMLEQLSKKGALGLVERLVNNNTVWGDLKGYLGATRPQDPSVTANLPAVIIHTADSLQKAFNGDAAISISGTKIKEVKLKNVLGYLPGTDPKLRDEYVVLSSHYDHLGVAATPKMEEGKPDSIYNGARDNGIGTAAVIDAARYFAKYPPKRSILFVTYTAEEAGLIGSAWYALHPLIPLNKLVYNLNIDNASYNDTSLITLVGLGRTTADANIINAVQAYGMHVNGDPTGGSLFFESDNYPLAAKGVPAPTFSLGMKTFDDEIKKRYHQLSDETGNMDMVYALKFIQSYILAAKYISDDPQRPRWTKGDQLEKEAQKLYGDK